MTKQEAEQLLLEKVDKAQEAFLTSDTTHEIYELDKYINALKIAIRHLEGRDGCKYCNGKSIIISECSYASMAIYGRGYADFFDGEKLIGDIDINYCPMCGRQLKEFDYGNT